MFKKTKLAIALVVALSAMGIVSANAFAVSSTVSPAGTTRATGTATFEGSGISIVCRLTLTNSLSAGPIVVARGNRIGEVTRVEWRECSGGNVETVLSLPWSLTINDSLPTVASLTSTNATGLLLNINNASFNLSIFGEFVNCLYSGTAGALLTLAATVRGERRYNARTLTALNSASLPLSRGGFGCPSTGHFAGTFTLEPAQVVTLS